MRFDLDPDRLPAAWYNVVPDLPAPLPPLRDPPGADSRLELRERVLIAALREQDECRETLVDIPAEVRRHYLRLGRPTPLYRARRLEEYLGTRTRLYFKREDVLPTGSFKLNTSIPQGFYARSEGFGGIVTQTGAGQWGSALALACALYDLECIVFMSRASYGQKPGRLSHMRLFGADVRPSPSDTTRAGRGLLAERPDHPGSVNSGISEALETAAETSGFCYANGSNLPHTLLHNTIIGLETQLQLEDLGEEPDCLVGCVGGGSNLGGFALPFLPGLLRRGKPRIVAAESDAAPRLTRGEYRYEAGDPAGLTPLGLAYTLGRDFVPPPNHVGGLRQHGGSPVISLLRHEGFIAPVAYSQEQAFEAGRLFARLEGVVPAPETAHAVLAAIDLARESGPDAPRAIAVCFSGHGLLDLAGYAEVLRLAGPGEVGSER